MKKIITNLFRLSMLVAVQLVLVQGAFAQGNQDDNFLFNITTNAGTQTFKQEACGYGYAQFGASVQSQLCAEIVWGYGVSGDSLGCDTITNSYAGKFVVLRRGACNFSIKAYYAQQAGAIGVLIANHYATATDDGCSIIGMAPGTFADQVTVPCIFLCRDMADLIDNALKAGETVNGCFVLPRTGRPMAGYTNQIPVTQVDTFFNMGMQFINRNATDITNLVITTAVTGPNGYSTSFNTTVPSITAGLDTFLYVDAYLPPSVVGEYNVTFSNNVYNESRDTLTRKFWITDYTFGIDNTELRLDGGADRNDLFLNGGFIYQIGGLAISGPAGGNATYATFGIANIDSVYVDGNQVSVVVYDGDSDGDGFINLSGDWSDLGSDIVGIGVYDMVGTETEAGLIDLPLTDFLDPTLPISLQPQHPYYISLLYDGTFDGSGRNCAFSNTGWSDYLNFPTTPMFLGQFYDGGWGDRTVVCRMQLEGYVPGSSAVKSNLLDASKYTVTPNPANTYFNMNIDLAKTNEKVGLTLVSAQGKLIRQQTLNNFQNGQVRFDVADVPSGTYLMLIHTSEGQAIAKVAICH